jgi:two-component system NtrC family sensor kinase
VGQGTGLGLSICYGIISEHNGHIRAKNSPQGGAMFEIELPVVEPITGSQTPMVQTQTKPITTDSLDILVVDDEEPILHLLERVLSMDGHTVDTAKDGKFAWEKLQANTYDLIICDILMPDTAGPELYEKTTENFPNLAERFIFITGNVVDMDTRLFLEESGLAWLSKPFLPSDIEILIAQAAAKIKLSA